jgi:rhamnose transport system permease protein
VAVLGIIFGVVLHATPIGRGLYAMGNNADAATFAGVNVARTKFWLYVVCGVVAALAGVFWTLRFASARADNGTGLELSVVAAVLLGGVSIFGGRGGLIGVIAAVVLLGVLRNALQLAYVPANALTIVTGGLLIISVVGPNVVAMARASLHRRRRTRSMEHVAPPVADA